ncbi:flagellar hook-basal body complex protein FliE [Bradyrhizobium sp. U87765 SZCCT0131]|uniref:flagellar hook-basal body complex protein FliE n=1 Tax=unclassified Bradyrhizobium TaxID=2631580 RepID=UPI001BA996F5|nr:MULTISPECIES: flagellar hook-basal body complex protein FliE [unclassified Bradyrhizobium]MBR1216394.1 flagellar hook-basal body complex protein FliE [Bradyrhizobium sp. U87765 SZCCT0131]MBR1259858.1 flagellar hook-basal body complex protein FliE [Bradyrhizobium sp. U87765 SZCCT0134]MBR1305991.1 flagellar hook-basal body complex protein FliE [Bradyrhizobium sp. U87765 SZCCT0110]MBR1322358.1 flagellar hook-basal body complex protein FliE [Bradyrhizobium sp. U87765 SZCCT0109]MBR1352351.1 flag
MTVEAITSILKGADGVMQASEVTRTAPVAASQATSPAGFGSVLEQVAADAIGSVKAGEAASISYIQGKVSAQKVVEAVMSAEQTLQMAVAVRDKVVQAYQEVSRMAI